MILTLFAQCFLAFFALVFFSVAIAWRTYATAKRTGVNAFTHYSRDGILRYLAWGFRVIPLLLLAIYIDYVVGLDRISSFARFPFFENPIAQVSGMLILSASLSTIIIAQAQMGEYWRIGFDKKSKTSLVDWGLFRFSRNPIFLAVRFSILGIFLIMPCGLSLFTLILGDLVMQLQVRMEEKYLVSAVGDEYVDYCQRVRRWV